MSENNKSGKNNIISKKTIILIYLIRNASIFMKSVYQKALVGDIWTTERTEMYFLRDLSWASLTSHKITVVSRKLVKRTRNQSAEHSPGP